MLADPPELVGKRVRFIAVVRDHRGEVERARVRVWTEATIETYRNMSKEHSRTMATVLMEGLVKVVEAGDIGAIPEMLEVEEN